MVFGGKDTVVNLVDAVDPLTCGALASESMSWHDDQRLSFLLLAAVVRERVMVRCCWVTVRQTSGLN
jgi:hypothetical protein